MFNQLLFWLLPVFICQNFGNHNDTALELIASLNIVFENKFKEA